MFAHGFGWDQAMWRWVSPAFERDYPVVLFDHVGAGGSDLTEWSPYRYASLEGYARDVVEICEELDLRSVVFVGHSVSAMVGVLAAARAPEGFVGLVLVGHRPRGGLHDHQRADRQARRRGPLTDRARLPQRPFRLYHQSQRRLRHPAAPVGRTGGERRAHRLRGRSRQHTRHPVAGFRPLNVLPVHGGPGGDRDLYQLDQLDPPGSWVGGSMLSGNIAPPASGYWGLVDITIAPAS